MKRAISKDHDRFISTEDDNEFSVNFLMYMNRCLDIFSDDERVMAVCGCKEADWIVDNDTSIVATKMFAPYGIGTWVKRDKRIRESIPKCLLNKKNLTIKLDL